MPLRRAAYHRPALAPAPVPSVAGSGREDLPCRLAVPRPFSRPGPQAVPRHPKASLNLGTGRKSGLSDFAPSRLQAVRDPDRSRTSPVALLVAFLGHAAFAVASIRFQNPLFGAGLSAFVSKGPIPVSMSGRCVAEAIRATARGCSYPLLA